MAGPPVNSRLIAAEVRRAKAFEMYAQGRTTQQIADAFHVAIKTARRWLLEFRRNVSELTAEEIKLRSLATLELILERWEWKAMQGDSEALDQVLKIQDRQAKFLGLYAPQKIDGTMQYSGSIEHISRDDMRREVMDRLRKLEQQKNRLAALDVVPSEN